MTKGSGFLRGGRRGQWLTRATKLRAPTTRLQSWGSHWQWLLSLLAAILVVAAMAVAFIILKDPAHTADPEAVSDPRHLRTVATEARA